MDHMVIAFADTDQPHVVRGRAALSAIGGVEVWRGLWIVEGVCGTLEARQSLEPVLSAFSHPAHLPPGIIISPLNTDCEIVMGLSMSVKSRELYQQSLSATFETRHNGTNNGVFSFFGQGEQRFGALAKSIDRAFTMPRTVTPFCLLTLEHGSDKGLGWHTYTPVYSLLLDAMEHAPRHVLEFGIGTNFEDVPSSMGLNGTPGASLRAWRDYLPNAAIFGADVDRRILFQEDRIRTLFVDQLDVSSIERLWKALPNEPFDLILDDGLHTFEAAEHTLDGSVDHLGAAGVYIIEDVPNPNAQAYIDLANGHGLDGFLVVLPHALNRYDNTLLVAAKPITVQESADDHVAASPINNERNKTSAP